VVDQVRPQDVYDQEKPEYAAWRYYDSPQAWADASLQRLKSWHFTTIGGWGDYAVLNRSKEQTLWLTPVVSLGASGGSPWLDMWNPDRLAEIEQRATQVIDPLRDDPRVIGYYCDNELGWWNAELWRLTFEHQPSSTQRKKLLAMLRQDYRGDWSELLKDFEPSPGVDGWDDLDRGGFVRHRPGSNGIRTMRRFLALAAERYYQVMSDVVRRHDPDALFLGDRYQSFFYPEVARAAAKHVDVVSSNLNAHWNDGTFLRCYLDSLHQLTAKPILVSEFYMSADENRSGNPNTGQGFPVVATQAARAAAAKTSLHALARLPYVVGVDWFQYADEPPHGRFDGEDFNFGLVDIHDTPYSELTAAFAGFSSEQVTAARKETRLDARNGVPPAPADPLADFDRMTALKHWDRERGFVPPTSSAPLADLYLCWTSEAVYVGLYAIDVVERSYYADQRIADADRAEWSVRLPNGRTIVTRIGGGDPPVVNDREIGVKSHSGVNLNPRLIAALEIPAERWGKESLKPGDDVAIDVVLRTHGRAYEYAWKGEFRLAK
jgi:hypothetical protein